MDPMLNNWTPAHDTTTRASRETVADTCQLDRPGVELAGRNFMRSLTHLKYYPVVRVKSSTNPRANKPSYCRKVPSGSKIGVLTVVTGDNQDQMLPQPAQTSLQIKLCLTSYDPSPSTFLESPLSPPDSPYYTRQPPALS